MQIYTYIHLSRSLEFRPPYYISSRKCRFFANVVLFPQFDTVWKYLLVLKFVVKILNWHVSMHEQQESVSGEVSHCLCRSPSDSMTSLKSLRVLEIQGYITKNHLLRTCSVYFIQTMLPVRVNGRVQQNGQVISHVWYINILAWLRAFRTSFFVPQEKNKCYNMTFRRYLVAIIKCRLKSFSSDMY